MKTPLQELIEWVRNHPGQTGKSSVIAKATELLEKEKEVIKRAFNDGIEVCGYESGLGDDDDEYYNETFNTK